MLTFWTSYISYRRTGTSNTHTHTHIQNAQTHTHRMHKPTHNYNVTCRRKRKKKEMLALRQNTRIIKKKIIKLKIRWAKWLEHFAPIHQRARAIAKRKHFYVILIFFSLAYICVLCKISVYFLCSVHVSKKCARGKEENEKLFKCQMDNIRSAWHIMTISLPSCSFYY